MDGIVIAKNKTVLETVHKRLIDNTDHDLSYFH
jgi:hypothetical protein